MYYRFTGAATLHRSGPIARCTTAMASRFMPRKQSAYYYALGVFGGLGTPILTRGAVWPPAWAFLLLFLLAVVGAWVVHERLAPWWVLIPALVVGTLLSVYM